MEADAAQRDFECWQTQYQRRQQQQRERERQQEQHHREQRNVRAWLARSEDDGNSGPAQLQPQAETMDSQSSAAWNEWWSQAFDDHIDEVLQIIGEEVRKVVANQGAEMQDWARKQIAVSVHETVERQIAARLEKKGLGESDERIVPLSLKKGGRNNAA
jgi:hypothetical protein